ncbi:MULTISPECIES: hypothetical protein [unclassified Microbulbifer]|uniref:hypothetical protein n=1 Tax=unclassified Microbulbifer TaxID=2619833 RepID=UPI0027E56978|nr:MULTISPECIES: hypothetical protein [unclassified Microbulbifer]
MSGVVHQKDYRGFVYFHPSTKGHEGKAVFIDKGLLRRFMDLVDTSTEEGRLLAVKVTELKSKAAGFESASNISDGFSHRQTFGSVEVTYAVFQTREAMFWSMRPLTTLTITLYWMTPDNHSVCAESTSSRLAVSSLAPTREIP